MKTIEQTLFEIAKIVSNEYIGKEKNFTYNRLNGFYSLRTVLCDAAPSIRVVGDALLNSITRVDVNGEYTIGWEPVTEATFKRIKQHLQTPTDKQ